MEIIIVLAIVGVLLGVVFVGMGSAFGRSRDDDELQSERGANESAQSGMGSAPTRDRPAGPDAEGQEPGPGEWHPRDADDGARLDAGPEDDAALPSDAAGKQDTPDRRQR